MQTLIILNNVPLMSPAQLEKLKQGIVEVGDKKPEK